MAFDMDQTAVAQHSHGRLTTEGFGNYVASAKKAFVEVVPVLLEQGVKVGIATHSDSVEYVGDVAKGTHLVGDDLVNALLKALFPEHIASQLFVVAYNPRRRGDTDNPGKTHHIKRFAAHFDVATQDILLFDDDEQNITATSKLCSCVQVDPQVGFEYSNLQAPPKI